MQHFPNVMCQSSEATELHAFMANRGEIWGPVESCFRVAQRDKAAGMYKPEYLESDLRHIVKRAADKYVREYCPQSSHVNDFFPPLIRQSVAMLIVNEFENELTAGNSWL